NILVPRGKERNLDSLSSGERKGKSPNPGDVIDGSRCRPGVVGLVTIRLPAGREVTKLRGSRSDWNVTPQRVTAPKTKLRSLPRRVPEYGRARETWSEPAGATPQG